MVTINSAKLFDLSEVLTKHEVFSVNQYQGLKADDVAKFEGLLFSIDGDDLIISGGVLGDFTITVKGYGKANGKSKFNYLTTYDGAGALTIQADLLADGLVYNHPDYNENELTKVIGEEHVVKSYSVSTTAFNDVIDLSGFQTDENQDYYIKKGFNIKTDKGNDTITGSVLNDTITAGLGRNTICVVNFDGENYVDFGVDVVTLTKGEDLLIDFTADATTNSARIVGKDIVILGGGNSKIILKDLAAKDVLGPDGSIHYDTIVEDVRDFVKAQVQLLDNEKNTKKYTGTYLGSVVTLNNLSENLDYSLSVDLSKSTYSNTVDISSSQGKSAVKGGSADDLLTDGLGNGTYSLGLGCDTIRHFSGDDVVYVTSGEQLTLNTTNALTNHKFHHYKIVKNDVVLYGNEYETTSVTIKNYAVKDVDGETGWVKAQVSNVGDPINLEDLRYHSRWGTEVDAKTKSFTGSRLHDEINASGFVTTVAQPNAKTKGVTIDAKGGDNFVRGSDYADVIKAGADSDHIGASKGNDTYTLGAGYNTATYSLGEDTVTYNKDTYNLTNCERFELIGLATTTEDVTNDLVTYHKIGNDIVAVKETGNFVNAEIVLKNLASGKVNADVQIHDGNTEEDHEDDSHSIWDKEIYIEATSATVTGTRADDAIDSGRAKATTFVASYTGDTLKGLFGDDTITVELGDGVHKKAADTIKITTSDKTAPKLSAYELEYSYADETGLTINANGIGDVDYGTISYKGDFTKGLYFVDATGAKWSFYNEDIDPQGSADLSRFKTNNIALVTDTDIKDSKKNDIIYGDNDDNAQTFSYSAGKDLYISKNAQDDVYVAALDKKTTIIINDIAVAAGMDPHYNKLDLTVSSGKGYGLLFNVNADGTLVDDDVKIFDIATYQKITNKTAKTLTGDMFAAGTITLEDALTITPDNPLTDPNEYACSLDVFRVKKDNNYVELTVGGGKTVENIREVLASWLSADGRTFTDAFDALQNGSKDDLTDLITIYTTGILPA